MVTYKIEISTRISKKPNYVKYILNCYNLENNDLCGEILFKEELDTNFFDIILSDNDLLKYFPNKKTIYINSLTVEDNYKNLGVANYMMKIFLDNFKNQNNFDSITLLVVPFEYGEKEKIPLNLLIKFYEKFGFKIIGYNFENPLMIYRK
jgi:ribosomal protein S18 acetylase RimI-like enzyme